jgi:hypothetical protein
MLLDQEGVVLNESSMFELFKLIKIIFDEVNLT